MNYPENLARILKLARWAVYFCWAVAFISLATIPALFAEASGAVDVDYGEDGLSLAAAFVLLIHACTFVVSAILVALWIYRTHEHLQILGLTDLKFSPGWAVGWYFIPIANLFVPRSVMGELWQRSHGPGQAISERNLNLWWGFWISASILEAIGDQGVNRFDLNPMAGFWLIAASMVLTSASALVLRTVIRNITNAVAAGRPTRAIFD